MKSMPIDAEQANRVAIETHRLMLFAAIKKAANEGQMGIEVCITERENEELKKLGYKVSKPGLGDRVVTWGDIT